MNYQEILEEVKKQSEGSVSMFAYEGLDGDKVYPEAKYGTEEYKIYKNPVLGVVKQVAQHGGEGKGEDWWVVYHFVDHNVFIRVDGYYQSYNGTEFYDGWNCCSEVSPQQKTITVYE